MIKKTFFLNIIALSVILFSCLQLHAKIVGEIDLKKATGNKIFEMKVGGHVVKYSFLGTVLDEKGNKKKFYLIQLPSREQDYSDQCGTHAYENCKVLSQKNFNLAKVVKNLNSDEQEKKIFAIKTCLRLPKDARRLKKDDEKEKNTKYNFKIVNLTETDWSATTPGVYMILTAGERHWIAVRLEKTNNGDIAILVVDSFYGIESNRWAGYSWFIKSLIKALGYEVVEYLPSAMPLDEDGYPIG